MKKVLLLLVFFIIIPATTWGQFHDGPPPRGDKKHFDRISQLEKIKLLEALDLEEEQVLRLFSRRDSHQDEQRVILEKRENLIKELDEKFIAGDEELTPEIFNGYMEKLAGYEKTLAEQRKAYLYSLKEILSEEDVIKYIVFESKFRQMVRNILMDERGRGRKGK
ncbi:MAG: hypothetical protein SCALA702_09540 [Melioribacteraceae bacterium]|nr:MAG: hypothetical protein SCALA702_09540 [Melioribacteraceae bacterium]